MAIDPSSLYPGKINLSDPTGYPYGKPQNITVPGDLTGTPLDASWLSDLFGFQQALLAEGGGIVPTGTPDKVGASQYLTALQAIIASGQSGKRGRLVKILTTSGTLLINDAADDTDPAYITSLDIKTGDYLIYAHGGGGGGGSAKRGGGFSFGGSGGGGGGVDYGVITINANLAFTIGAGGAGAAGGSAGGINGSNGGDTTISTLTGGGGEGGGANSTCGGGGTGFFTGQAGGVGAQTASLTAAIGGAAGGGPSGGKGASSVTGGAGGLASGGAGGGHTGSSIRAGGAGGDGYIEIYEWSL